MCVCVFAYNPIGLGAYKPLGQVGLTLVQITVFDLCPLHTVLVCVSVFVYTDTDVCP